jgi:hypothetical protein
MRQIAFLVGCILLLTVAIAPTATATPVSYNYTGSVFTSLGCYGSSYPCNSPAEFAFSTSDFVAGAVTLDFSSGTAASGLIPTSWTITTTAFGPAGHNESHTVSSTPSPDFDLYINGMSFDVNAAGDITNWNMNIQHVGGVVYFITTRPTGDWVTRDVGLYVNSGSNSTSGAWTQAAVPEASSFVLLAIGLACVIVTSYRKRRSQILSR